MNNTERVEASKLLDADEARAFATKLRNAARESGPNPYALAMLVVAGRLEEHADALDAVGQAIGRNIDRAYARPGQTQTVVIDTTTATPRLRLALQLADAVFTVRSWIGDDTTPSEDATYRGVATMLDEASKLLKLVDELDGLPDDAVVRRKP